MWRREEREEKRSGWSFNGEWAHVFLLKKV
jgi:hypothetical protein